MTQTQSPQQAYQRPSCCYLLGGHLGVCVAFRHHASHKLKRDLREEISKCCQIELAERNLKIKERERERRKRARAESLTTNPLLCIGPYSLSTLYTGVTTVPVLLVRSCRACLSLWRGSIHTRPSMAASAEGHTWRAVNSSAASRPWSVMDVRERERERGGERDVRY